MLSHTKLFFISCVFFIYGIQIWHTVHNQINWPFCSHNFYYHRSPLVKSLFRVVLKDNSGDLFTVDPRHTLPIEGYRCGSIFREVFANSSNFKKKELFSKLLLERLNTGGWKKFDERFSSIVPKTGKKFIELKVEKHWIDTTNYASLQDLPIVKQEVIYQYPQ